jgi:Holliday junction resolvase RusA-like endonuclease
MSALDFPHDELAEPVLSFTVYGNAAPAGSKRHVGGGRIVDSSKRSAPWKDQVAQAAALAYANAIGVFAPDAPLLDGPLAVRMTFYVPRPKGHYSRRDAIGGFVTGALVPSAPAYPTTRPDVLKLARAVEDACTGIVWRDDAQIVSEWLQKRYGEPARVEVVVIAA